VTTTHPEFAPDDAPMRSTAELIAAGREITTPFRLALRIGSTNYGGRHEAASAPLAVPCERVLRVLPGRRLVAKAWLGDTPMLLKLYLGRGAARYAARDARGSRLLIRAGVQAPRLREVGTTADRAGRVLLYDFLEDSRPLDDRDVTGVAGAVKALASLHALGNRHVDPHPGNFLLAGADEDLWLVDADGVRPGPLAPWSTRALGRRASLRNLAALCAARSIACDAELGTLIRAYAEARGWPLETIPALDAALARATRRARRYRLARYARKAVRPSGEFNVERNAHEARLCVREVADAMAGFFADPEATVRRGTLLKDGNSATVVRAGIAGRNWIVKRYNVKDAWQRLRRSLRPLPRYRNAWLRGQQLHLAGVPSARPVALLERRTGWQRDVAYLVMEDAGDCDLLRATGLQPPDDALVASVVELFRALDALGLAHGDTKATNFLVRGERVALIDLDAMRVTRHDGARDRERFLANWRDRPAVRQRFAEAFRAAGLGG
jgi:tRNA A-37 threonylcarbamoyl transferase component Bud32